MEASYSGTVLLGWVTNKLIRYNVELSVIQKLSEIQFLKNRWTIMRKIMNIEQ